jgi:membrane carboxypeptidase/penicillin-binding protein
MKRVKGMGPDFRISARIFPIKQVVASAVACGYACAAARWSLGLLSAGVKSVSGMAKNLNTPKKSQKKRRFYKKAGFWLFFLTFCAVLLMVGFVVVDSLCEPYRKQAATYDLNHINDLEVPSVILDRKNKEIGRIFVQNRSIIPIRDVPDVFIDALRAGEDQRFWSHGGVDYIGVVRAVLLNLKSGEENSGASTITQQLARNAFDLKGEAVRKKQGKYERKITEIFLSQRIEKNFSKKQILEFYLNRIYFGSGFYGIRSASLGYFGKEPRDLTAVEAATIVGAIKSPTLNSPLASTERSMKARNMVLMRMADLGIFSHSEAEKLCREPVLTNSKPLQRGTSHLYERIADEIRRTLGDDAFAAGGYRIHTSIDASVQSAMEKTLEASLLKAESHAGYANQKKSQFKRGPGQVPDYLQGAGMMIDHQTGEVIAYVGGRDYTDTSYDVIEYGRRPLGTAFLPFVYAAGLEKGLTPVTMVEDEQIDNRSVMVGGMEGIVGEWGMEIANPTYEKRITVRRALESSKIAASLRFANTVGLDRVLKTAIEFGLPFQKAEALPRLVVGWDPVSLKEAVNAYSAFAQSGNTRVKNLTYVNRVENASGQVIYSRQKMPQHLGVAVDEATAYQIHDIMRESMNRGNLAGFTDHLVEKPFTGAAKSGTTFDFSDNWFLGYNGRVTCGIWIGFLKPGKSIYQGAFGKELAGPVWLAAMNAAADGFSGRVISQPESVVEAKVCRVSGQRATQYCYEMVTDPASGSIRSRPSAQIEFFRKGTENIPYCQLHSGAGANDAPGETGSMNPIAVIDSTPVQIKGSILEGADPYNTQLLNVSNESTAPPVNRLNVLDNYDFDSKATRPAQSSGWPERLKISSE